MIGVYIIAHIASGRVYVGGSCDVESRWARHQCLLRNGYGAKKLQVAWNKYGPDAFVFKIIKTCANRSQLQWLETQTIAKYKATTNGFNIRPIATSHDCSNSTRKKISKTMRGHRYGRKIQTKRRKPTRRKSDGLSLTHRKRISLAMKGRTLSDEHRQSLSRAWIERRLSEKK